MSTNQLDWAMPSLLVAAEPDNKSDLITLVRYMLAQPKGVHKPID